jgi:hypothetical protein
MLKQTYQDEPTTTHLPKSCYPVAATRYNTTLTNLSARLNLQSRLMVGWGKVKIQIHLRGLGMTEEWAAIPLKNKGPRQFLIIVLPTCAFLAKMNAEHQPQRTTQYENK